MKRELMEAWRWRDTKDSSSSSHFVAATHPFPIMNVLIWNCIGAMKPLFRKTVMYLVDWHNPIVMVIIETRLSEVKADKIIETLPFDGAVVTDTIGFVGGIWLLWHLDLVQVEALVSTE